MNQEIPVLPYSLIKTEELKDKGGLSLHFKGKKLLHWLYRAAAILVVLNIIAVSCKYLTDHPNAWGIIPQFELDNERNIPTYFSSFILLLSSFLLFTIAFMKQRQRDKYTWHWRLLAFVFLYMSVDESAGIHEMLIYPLRDNFNMGGIFYFSWVIAGGLLVLGLGIYYLRFLFSLEARLRKGLILAGTVYVGGALGVELFGGYYADTYGLDNLGYAMITTVEETLEIAGVLLLMSTLYSYLEQQLAFLRLNLRRAEPEVELTDILPQLKAVPQEERLN
ncbi:hypothetical protein [Pontibacter flavimaris]|uniref:Uncharacterized protein n=1 Tax=Pontibacter flavimaris TaxID=1797110 RepID=A0A1Q5PHJ7_9BACT|nr:hypothetical protein [Pontibacter flavimaris]OKL41705.1 hypothetical protein A3841_11810 [Pontibacter flavimaris]